MTRAGAERRPGHGRMHGTLAATPPEHSCAGRAWPRSAQLRGPGGDKGWSDKAAWVAWAFLRQRKAGPPFDKQAGHLVDDPPVVGTDMHQPQFQSLAPSRFVVEQGDLLLLRVGESCTSKAECQYACSARGAMASFLWDGL